MKYIRIIFFVYIYISKLNQLRINKIFKQNQQQQQINPLQQEEKNDKLKQLNTKNEQEQNDTNKYSNILNDDDKVQEEQLNKFIKENELLYKKEELQELIKKDKEDLDEIIKVQKEGWLQVNIQDSISRFGQKRDFINYKYEQNEQSYQLNRQQQNDYMYCRLSGINLYYTNHEKDLVVMGAISITNIKDVKQYQNKEWCFRVDDNEADDWELCAKDSQEKRDWVCAIYKVLGKECPQETVIEEREIVKQPDCNEAWNYEQQGDDWECSCKDNNQSPINLPNEKECGNNDKFNRLQVSTVFRFKEVSYDQLQLKFQNNLINIQMKEGCVNKEGYKCDKLVFMSIVDTDFIMYDVEEINIHVPAEHSIDNQQFDMEIQAIAKSIEDVYFNNKLIVSWLGRIQPGVEPTFFASFNLMNLPDKKNPIKYFAETTKPFNIKQLMDLEQDDNYYDYYSYQGSLTQPPCTNNIKYIVFMEPFQVSLTIIEMFKQSQILNYDDKQSYDSNRRLQPLQQRTVYVYQNKNKKQLEKQQSGHFEKITLDTSKFFYVPGKSPSGFKNTKQININLNNLFNQIKTKKDKTI